MPSTPIHDALTLATAAAAVPVYWHYMPPKDPAPLGFLVGGIIVSGFLLSADLDINSRPYHRWGAFRIFWWPYQKLIPHRSWISHNFLIGPLFRAIYLLAICYLLIRAEAWLINQWMVPVDQNRIGKEVIQDARRFIRRHELWTQMAILGLVASAFVHTAADAASTSLKRRARRMRRLW